MRIHVTERSRFVWDDRPHCLALPVFEGEGVLASSLITPQDAATVKQLLKSRIVTGKAQESYLFMTPAAPYKSVLLLGLGKRDACDAEVARRTMGKACEVLQRNRVGYLTFEVCQQSELAVAGFVEGLMLGQYRFERYKAPPEDGLPKTFVTELAFVVDSPEVASRLEGECERAVLMCENANWARGLANTAPNDLTPTTLAETAQVMAGEAGCDCEILDEQRMAALGMNALLGVARGSAEPPRLICLRYRHPKARRTLALVGKGITFDAGGISIKPAEDMHEMKYDMCGAAAVLGAMKTVCGLRPKLDVVAVVPAAENMPGSKAQKPGDIVKAYNGKTIEIHNTDAEGRLILADALAYTVDTYQPEKVVDLATLTGSCVIALGHYAAGLMTNDESLGRRLQAAGEATGERVWPLPLWKDYDRLVEGTHADLCNIGPRGEAGSIVGACFLRHFVGDIPWAHLDIAGTAWGAKHIPYLEPKSASGYGVRLLTQWLLDEAL